MSKYLPYGLLKKEKFEKFQIENLSFLKDNNYIRSIKYKNIEFIKMVSFLVRDKNWNNYEPKIISSKIIKNKYEIKIIIDLEFSDVYQKLITKNSYIITNNSLNFLSEGKFLTNFVTNRSGFNILFPLINYCGNNIQIVNTDSKKIKSSFPEYILPDQPFINIKEISYTLFNIDFNYKFNGIKFEMEDQRNWGDASYKVYSGSLLDPFPITIPKNHNFFQEISISLNNNHQINKSFNQKLSNKKLQIKKNLNILGPKVGIKFDNLNKFPLNNKIDELDFNHILIEFDLTNPNISSNLKRISYFLNNIQNKNIFAIILIDHNFSIKKTFLYIKKIFNDLKLNINLKYLLICPKIYLNSFQPAGKWPKVPPLKDYYKYAKIYFPESKIVGGMVTNFTELNRKKPEGKFNIISHSFTPIVHDSSDHALMETPETVKYMVKSIRKFNNNSQIHIGPICIGMHHNPYGEKLVENKSKSRIEMTNNDLRHDSLLSIVWSIGMYEEFAKQKIEYLTFNSLYGFHGILENNFNKRILYLFNKIILSFSNEQMIFLKTNENFFSVGICKNSILKILISNKTQVNQNLEVDIEGKIYSSFINEKNFIFILNNIEKFFILKKSSKKLFFNAYETKYLEIVK